MSRRPKLVESVPTSPNSRPTCRPKLVEVAPELADFVPDLGRNSRKLTQISLKIGRKPQLDRVGLKC